MEWRTRVKRILGYVILANIIPLWCLVAANFTTDIPVYFIGSESLYGYLLGWGANVLIAIVGLLFGLAVALIED